MGEDVNKQYLLDTLKLKVQIEGIQKEVQNLKKFYFDSIANYQFDCISNKYRWQIHETEDLHENLTLCEKMYIEIVDFLYEESKTLINIHYPECMGAEEGVYVSITDYELDENMPFD